MKRSGLVGGGGNDTGGCPEGENALRGGECKVCGSFYKKCKFGVMIILVRGETLGGGSFKPVGWGGIELGAE